MQNTHRTQPAELESCDLAKERNDAARRDEEYRCPVCCAVIPPEHLGRKVWCRRCGYLESCCNPEG